MMDGINDFILFRCNGCKCMKTTWLIKLVHTSPKKEKEIRNSTELK
jgi:hypothetical protein